MKIQVDERTGRRNKGFTLIEMIGVLAIISILAAVLLPRVFQAIADSQINNVAQSAQGVKSAVTQYYAQEGQFPTSNIGTELIQEGLLEQVFESPIGDGASIISATATGSVPTSSTINGTDYDLDGDGSSAETSGTVISIQISGLSEEERIAIDETIDGDELAGGGSSSDTSGRVIYDSSNLYIYLAHR